MFLRYCFLYFNKYIIYLYNTLIRRQKLLFFYTNNNTKDYKISYINNTILVIHNHLSKTLCKQIITKFEEEKDEVPLGKSKGVTQSGYNPSVKLTTDFNITLNSKWKLLDNILSEKLTKVIKEYFEYLQKNNFKINTIKITDTGYQIQKYDKKKGQYAWHHDFIIDKTGDKSVMFRAFTFLWYLNTVDEGGETSFYDFKVKPEAGKLIIFPASIMDIHKGEIPLSDDKYIITGWIYFHKNI